MKQAFAFAGVGLAMALSMVGAHAQTSTVQPRITHVRQMPEPPAIRELAQTTHTQGASGFTQDTTTAPRPLFSIGNLPATVWAPVQPPYNSQANRNSNANPYYWGDDAAM
jgi:hypothetical protein